MLIYRRRGVLLLFMGLFEVVRVKAVSCFGDPLISSMLCVRDMVLKRALHSSLFPPLIDFTSSNSGVFIIRIIPSRFFHRGFHGLYSTLSRRYLMTFGERSSAKVCLLFNVVQ